MLQREVLPDEKTMENDLWCRGAKWEVNKVRNLEEELLEGETECNFSTHDVPITERTRLSVALS